jgi:hypothetical protein
MALNLFELRRPGALGSLVSKDARIRVKRAGDLRQFSPGALKRGRPPRLSKRRSFHIDRNALRPPTCVRGASTQREKEVHDRPLRIPHGELKVARAAILRD